MGGVGGSPLGELHGDAAALSRPASVKCESRQPRQGSAGTFGICSYQQERSALQSLRGEGGERAGSRPVRKHRAQIEGRTGKPG